MSDVCPQCGINKKRYEDDWVCMDCKWDFIIDELSEKHKGSNHSDGGSMLR